MTALPVEFTSRTKPSGCIAWTGSLNTRGYPYVRIGDFKGLAHRYVYEFTHGPIPEEMTVDHLCGYKRCVNPDHLELVTRTENVLRFHEANSVCAAGHELDARDNRHGRRYCSTCRKTRDRERRSINPEREWAVANGFDVGTRGRIPFAVKRAYEAAVADGAA